MRSASPVSFVLLLVLVALAVAACSADGTGPERDRIAASVAISPAADTLEAIGDTIEFTAVVRDSAGDVIPDASVTWTSADPHIVEITAAGRAISKARGSAAIQGRSGDVTGTATVISIQVPAAVRLVPDSVRLVPGDRLGFTARSWDANDVPIYSLDSFTWSTSNSAIATVTHRGVVDAVSFGSAQITATLDGMSDSGNVRVAELALTTLDVGGRHTCGLTAEGALYCWGHDANGQLGDGAREHRPAPVRHEARAYASIAVGNWHTCGITGDGAAYCFGGNADGQVTGDSIDVLQPRLVAGGVTFATVYAGGLHTCGLTAEGRAYCWGDNTYGALGNDQTSFGEPSPNAVVGDLTFTALALGGLHTCGLTGDGAAYCWGYNGLGQLGIGVNDSDAHAVPESVAGGLKFVRLAAGSDNTCGITESGELYCWGGDNSGEIGAGDATPACFIDEYEHRCANVPTAVSGGILFESVAIGAWSACGVSISGTAYCWGNNSFGQLGIGAADHTPHRTPGPVAGGLKFNFISAGLHHVCGFASDGLAYCWGRNESGEIGTGAADSHRVQPTRVARQAT